MENTGTLRRPMVKYVVLDRDGTLIRHIPYLCDPDQVQLLPTVIAGLQKLKLSGCKLFLHTNQSGIGRGFYSFDDASHCNTEMIRQVGLGRELFEKICVAPEAPDQDTTYRKPSPKFGLEIIAEYAASEQELCYIGDNVTDLLTARNLGCIGVGVNTASHDLRLMLEERGMAEDFPVFETFLDATTYVVDGSW